MTQSPHITVRLRRIPGRPEFELPRYETAGAAGLDLRAAIDSPVILEPHKVVKVNTGLAVEIPLGFEGQVRPRSGLAFKRGVTVANAPGTIDSDYRGEIGVLLVNLTLEPVEIAPGERIAQIVFAAVTTATLEVADALDVSERGDGGFGHTGHL